jgi:hypothetical protein
MKRKVPGKREQHIVSENARDLKAKAGWEGTNLSLEVVTDKLERVIKGVNGGLLDLRTWLLLASSLDDGGEDLVRLGGKDLGFLRGPSNQSIHPRISTTDLCIAVHLGKKRKQGREETHDRLANEPQSLKRVDPQSGIRRIADELKEELDEILPLAVRKLDDCDGGDDLGGDGTCTDGRGAEGSEGLLFDEVFNVDVEGEPAVGVLGLTRGVLGGRSEGAD